MHRMISYEKEIIPPFINDAINLNKNNLGLVLIDTLPAESRF